MHTDSCDDLIQDQLVLDDTCDIQFHRLSSVQKHLEKPSPSDEPDYFFKPRMHGRRPRAPGFLKLLWSTCRYACVCVCVSAPEAINNQWYDIDRVRLVKQVLWLFLLLITSYGTCRRYNGWA